MALRTRPNEELATSRDGQSFGLLGRFRDGNVPDLTLLRAALDGTTNGQGHGARSADDQPATESATEAAGAPKVVPLHRPVDRPRG